MSVIQKIRDKGALISVILIALSLLGFILMDAFAGRSQLFGSDDSTIGSVNGKKIDRIAFSEKVKQQEEAARAQGYDMGEAGRQQVLESVWNGEVTQSLMEEQFAELGLGIGKKEINDYLFGPNPPQDLKQRFTDPNTGVYDAAQAQQLIAGIKSRGSAQEKAQLGDYVANLEFSRKMEKYSSLLGNTLYYPKWFLEKQNADNSLIGRIAYVSVPYTTISDSAVKVTDDEIKAYVNDHKKEFEQKEETRSISYVVFSAAPTAADTAATRNTVAGLRDQFAGAADVKTFLTHQGTDLEYFDGFVSASKIQVPNKDSITALPNGGIYGPYLDQRAWVLAKKVDSRVLPDSVKCRHILIGTTNPQTGQPLFPDSVAKARIDSIAAAIAGGASFDALEQQYSTDEAAKKEKGVMTFSSFDIQGQNFAKEFGQFILFDGRAGQSKVVKTQFGYHYIQILNHINPTAHYKIGYLARNIAPSDETENSASNAATQFAGDSRDLKAFNANIDKNLRSKGVNKLVAEEIKAADFNINGLGAARDLVRDIYAADEGDVLEPRRVGDAYIVAAVTNVVPAGVQTGARVRATVEPILRNKKKAEQIKKKIGTVRTLEAVASATGQVVQPADSIRFSGANQALGFESKVIGAVFNPANKGKVVSEPIEGQSGVFALRVDDIGGTQIQNADINQQRQMLQMQARQAMQYRSPIEALKASADIKDNRAKYY